MSFDRAWLALRAPADTAARSAALAGRVTRVLAARGALQAIDLACGAGANARYLVPRLPPRQRWLLVDDDPALLADAATGLDAEVEVRRLDLAAPGALDVLDRQDLVTASALLDLVSAAWLEALLVRCHAAGAVVLFALSYDGRAACSPADPDDAAVLDLVNRHQARDKGFGPALGPAAATAAADGLAALGYHVEEAASDWVLSPEAPALQAELIAGWAAAATEVSGADAAAVAAWRARRLGHVAALRSSIVVGHRDVAGWPSHIS